MGIPTYLFFYKPDWNMHDWTEYLLVHSYRSIACRKFCYPLTLDNNFEDLAEKHHIAKKLPTSRMSADFTSSARVTGNPPLTACFSDSSRHAASDSGISQSKPLRIKWQDWIALGGRTNSSS